MSSQYELLTKLYHELASQCCVEERKELGFFMPKNVTLNNIKGYCFVCDSVGPKRSIHEDYSFENTTEKFVEMLGFCFNIKIKDDNRCGEMCDECVTRLRDAVKFRKQVESADTSFMGVDIATDDFILISSEKASNDNGIILFSEDDVAAVNELKKIETPLPPGGEVGKEIEQRKNSRKKDIHRSKKQSKKKIKNNGAASHSPTDKMLSDNLKIKVKTELKSELSELEPDTTVCPICGSDELFHVQLRKHYKNHFPKYMCDICGKGLNSKGHYSIHLNVHKNIKYPCKLCDKTYKTQQVLSEHVKKQHMNIKIQKYKCYKCPMRFVNYRTRKKHMFDEHGVACKKYVCALCNKSYFSQAGHKLHFNRIHLMLKDFICKECNRGFGTQMELKLHMRKHSNVRNFSCESCGKKFKDKNTLNRHQVVHTNVKAFKCQFCELAFAHRSNMMRHEKKFHLLNGHQVKDETKLLEEYSFLPR